ncbi:RHS repeat-associated core domain-containing protein, partial [Chitiniphilus shinanonensis]
VWWDYRYNALGQRVKKTDNASNTTLFVYDEQGQLLGEYDGSGQPRLDTIWLENLPVAVVQAATPAPKVYYAWADHLGTPRQLSNPADTKVVWEWAIAEPFGQSSANADPDNDGQQLVYNLRFPGQYFDAETGRYYNYFRDYDPRIGRYIQSDPIGLVGGVNTYSYSNGNSITYSDPLGLTSCNPVDFAKCQRKCSADGMMVESCETYTILPWVEQTVCACDGLCPTDSYENPGHHDASNRGPNPYNNSKSTLPQNHEELWKNSKRGSDGNRWTKIGSGKKAEYHRFQNDGNGNWHWNGSTNGRTASGVSRNINPNNIPKDVKAW